MPLPLLPDAAGAVLVDLAYDDRLAGRRCALAILALVGLVWRGKPGRRRCAGFRALNGLQGSVKVRILNELCAIMRCLLAMRRTMIRNTLYL